MLWVSRPVHSAQNFGANNFAMMTFLGSGSKFGFFTKRVAVRAVELSIGAFCTEFRCEQLCDDDISVGDWGQEADHQCQEIDIRNSTSARESQFRNKN